MHGAARNVHLAVNYFEIAGPAVGMATAQATRPARFQATDLFLGVVGGRECEHFIEDHRVAVVDTAILRWPDQSSLVFKQTTGRPRIAQLGPVHPWPAAIPLGSRRRTGKRERHDATAD